MRCVDVNVLVYAHRPESPRHEDYLGWLEETRRADEPLGLVPAVLSGFLRVVTHPRVFVDPTPADVAWRFVGALRAGPNTVLVEPGPRHWEIFRGLCRAIEGTGNDIPDAWLAAVAIESGGTWYSADRGFARFPRLRWRHPLDA